MADNNICSGLEIVDIYLDRPYYEMFLTQKRLQLRLNAINTDYKRSASEAANKAIYWYFCISSELKELIEWYTPDNMTNFEVALKEMRMEAIDVLHFVFNICLEFSYTEEHIERLMQAIPETTHIVEKSELERASNWLIVNLVNTIELLPWKTWKTYPTLAIEDLPLILENDIQKVLGYTFRLCYGLGMSKQDIINFYFAKNKENHRRQDDGY